MSENYPVNVFVTTSAHPTITATGVSNVPELREDTIPSASVALMLGITPNNLRQMVFKKKLTPVGKQGRKNLFARTEVEQLMIARER